MAEPSRVDVLSKVREILNTCQDPAEELIAMGEALAKIGRALKGLPPTEAKAVLRALMAMEGYRAD